MDGQAFVGGELVCEGEFMMALGKEEKWWIGLMIFDRCAL
jgi:hypothetical protein